ncbi:hypothetical protein SELR_18300 [Selenomonas ruminantium subsp. lactilytica TAM6421]|uniref:Uncharacterized protein n=1 Tax=Selenomonas ruminantium subsp. lactilytica (strain NBRC 103574 / TAM6421) TaxID=927704 RepID=I0GS01_SELRL|nr:hypothetical protein [Selenomonas ruminantium]BAL83538.1 hypothetical protein SELR_18300 [Selenomonas ruminantium subsp. lactilytica TAM6421]
MKEYNDYVATVKRWLKNYNQFKITIENLNEEIRACEEMQELDVTAGIARYSDMPGGGFSELGSVESSAAKHEARAEHIESMKQSVQAIERTLRKIDRSLNGLTGIEANLITGHYIERKTWAELGNENFYTEKWARVHGGRAVKKMSEMIFGLAPSQMAFVFAR